MIRLVLNTGSFNVQKILNNNWQLFSKGLVSRPLNGLCIQVGPPTRSYNFAFPSMPDSYSIYILNRHFSYLMRQHCTCLTAVSKAWWLWGGTFLFWFFTFSTICSKIQFLSYLKCEVESFIAFLIQIFCSVVENHLIRTDI